jgi:hypothetical protein
MWVEGCVFHSEVSSNYNWQFHIDEPQRILVSTLQWHENTNDSLKMASRYDTWVRSGAQSRSVVLSSVVECG